MSEYRSTIAKTVAAKAPLAEAERARRREVWLSRFHWLEAVIIRVTTLILLLLTATFFIALEVKRIVEELLRP